MKTIPLAALLAALAALPACKPAPREAPAAAAAAEHVSSGLIVAFKSEGRVVVLDHQAIPGLMEAMTMPFELQDAKLGAGLKPGDKVEFTLAVKGDDYKITALKKL